ncbi:hypothetical protein [Methanosarcina sp.]|uniref:hypothetical protein n=1 Tax=Methanosarcina sp. TaxID=2213 RepID=UPI002ABBB513|nr:hypothetical protein [Methanosarcina sp.]MDY9925919.1 hypothetical protein [Methanosarcina sp.]
MLRSCGLQDPVFSGTGSATQVRALSLVAEEVPEKGFKFLARRYEFSPENVPGEGLLPIRSKIDPTDVLLRALKGDERKAVELIAVKGEEVSRMNS